MRNVRSLAVLVAVGAAAALLAVPAGATAPDVKNGCTYLKVAEVNRITGLTFVKGKNPPAPPTVAACGYVVTDDPTTAVNVWVQPKPQTALAFRTAKKALADSAEPVTGLGKKAFYAGKGVNTVYVLKGSTLVYVQYVAIGNSDTAGIKDATVEMTKLVTGRL
jgi:hypothetical protein